METNRKEKICSVCGKIIAPNEGIHVGYMTHERMDYDLYMFNCSCGGTLAEKQEKGASKK